MSELTDDELNERIYAAQGYEKLGFPAVPTWQKPSGDGLPRGLYHEPKYATDLYAAWQLVDEAMRDCWSVNLNVNHLDSCTCTITTAGDVEYTAQAPTPARAIAEAWLAWREAKEVQR